MAWTFVHFNEPGIYFKLGLSSSFFPLYYGYSKMRDWIFFLKLYRFFGFLSGCPSSAIDSVTFGTFLLCIGSKDRILVFSDTSYELELLALRSYRFFDYLSYLEHSLACAPIMKSRFRSSWSSLLTTKASNSFLRWLLPTLSREGNPIELQANGL